MTHARTLRVMTFNLRNSLAPDGDNAWPHRRDCVVQTIRRNAPDVLGAQEAFDDQVRFLSDELPAYAVHGAGRDDGERTGEHTPIYYRTDRFDPLDAGHFWLSEQPHAPGSRSWDSSLPRMASWIKLRDRATDRVTVFCNTHLDHEGERARLESARLILRRFADAGAFVLTGDLNCSDGSAPVAALLEGDTLRDAYRAIHPHRAADECTIHDFRPITEGDRIDFVFHTAGFQPLEAHIDRTTCAGRFPSDHYPVAVTLAPIA